MEAVVVKDINGAIKVGYSGKALGNTQLSFGDNAGKNYQEFLSYFPGKNAFDMPAVGKDKIVNVDGISPEQLDKTECDALVTKKVENLLVLKAGDCIPLVFYVPGTILALAHVGRPGAMVHLPRQVIKYINLPPAQLKVYFGPSISTDSYKFPAKEYDKKLDSSWNKYLLHRGDYIHINLHGYVLDELKSAGVIQENITEASEDTGGANYFSHRRSRLTGEPDGRNCFAVHLL